MKSFLLLLNIIIRNHHRSAGFFDKIEKILTNYIQYIKQNFTSSDIFGLFASNQRILYFLLQQDLISADNLLKLNNDFLVYFYPEIKDKIDKKLLKKITENRQEIFDNFNDEEFNKRRQVGENHNYLCKLIREDAIVDFITYVNQTNWPLTGQIKESLFETNIFFYESYRNFFYSDDQPTLLEYAFFFGSVNIVKYLTINGAKLTYTLWPYAIHSNNAELIHLLEENHIVPSDSFFLTREKRFIPEMVEKGKTHKLLKQSVWEYRTFKTSLVQSIQCHHLNIYNYIKENSPEMQPEDDPVDDYYSSQFVTDSNTDVTFSIFLYFNYLCFPDDIDDKMLFFYACKYDYPSIVEFFLKKGNIDINMTIILN